MPANPLVLPNYPYLNKFSAEVVAEALERKDRLVELMMDPVGPDGTLINIPVDMLHILAFHLAYAGADAHTDHRRLIESRKRRDDSGMFEIYQWRPVGEFDDEPEPDSDGEDQAAAIAAQMTSQLSPDLRAKVAALLQKDTT